MNTYINSIIIKTFVNILIASIAIIAKETNQKVKVMDYYQSGKFNLYHLKNAQWTSQAHGQFKYVVIHVNSTHLQQQTLILTQQNQQEQMTKRQIMLQENMHNVGQHDIRGLNDAYMIQEENSQELSSKHYQKIVTLKMLVLAQKIHNPMQYAKGCIKQLEMF